MKLQIVEYREQNMLEGNILYRYMLELDEKFVIWTPPLPIKKEPKKICNKLMDKLLDDNMDRNLEHYVKLNKWPGLEREVIFEKEVPDAYLKELYIERRMKAIEEDF